jgi:hypothetical protein
LLVIAFRAQHQVDRHTQRFEVLFDGATRAKLACARADDLVVDRKLRHARALNPLREEVTQVVVGNFIGQFFELVDRGVLAAVSIEERAQQAVEIFAPDRLAQHTKDHRTFVKDDRLISR